MKTKWCVIVLCAAAVSCSRGGGASRAGNEAEPAAVRDDTLLEGTGIGELRIDQATIEEMQSTYGKSEPSTLSTASALDFRRPPLGFWFLKPAEGQDPPRLYAVRTLLYDDCYRGQTSKGIGILDSLEAVRAAYGPSEAEYVGMNEHMHYYGQQGVIFTTQHPKEILPALYAKARAVTGKEPIETARLALRHRDHGGASVQRAGSGEARHGAPAGHLDAPQDRPSRQRVVSLGRWAGPIELVSRIFASWNLASNSLRNAP